MNKRAKNPKRKPAPKDIVKMWINVSKFTLQINSSQVNAPQTDLQDHEIAHMVLEGKPGGDAPKDVEFYVHFYPDGSALPKAEYSKVLNRVILRMNWCQASLVLDVLTHAKVPTAYFRLTDGRPHGDVHGTFYPTGSTRKTKRAR